MNKSSTTSPVEKATEQINNDDQNYMSFGTNVSSTTKNPDNVRNPKQNKHKVFADIRKSRRLKKLSPINIMDYDCNNDFKIENLLTNVPYGLHLNNLNVDDKTQKSKREKINNKKKLYPITSPSFGLGESFNKPGQKIQRINNSKTFRNKTIKKKLNVKQNSILRSIKQNVFVEPKMNLKTAIDQPFTKPSILDNSSKNTVTSESEIPIQYSKTKMELYLITVKEKMKLKKKLTYMASLGLVQKEKSKATNSQENEDRSIKPVLLKQNSENSNEFTIPSENKNKNTHQTNSEKKAHSHLVKSVNKANDNQTQNKLILKPEILKSTHHPEHDHIFQCNICNIKFGSLDVSNDKSKINNPMEPSDMKSTSLKNNGDEVDSSLCTSLDQTGRIQNDEELVVEQPCNIMTCNRVGAIVFRSQCMNNIKYSLIKKGIMFKIWTDTTNSINVCDLHHKKILKFTECQLCGIQSPEKYKLEIFQIKVFQKMLLMDGISVKLDLKSLVCQTCRLYLIHQVIYSNSDKMEIRADIIKRICEHKNLRVPRFPIRDPAAVPRAPSREQLTEPVLPIRRPKVRQPPPTTTVQSSSAGSSSAAGQSAMKWQRVLKPVMASGRLEPKPERTSVSPPVAPKKAQSRRNAAVNVVPKKYVRLDATSRAAIRRPVKLVATPSAATAAAVVVPSAAPAAPTVTRRTYVARKINSLPYVTVAKTTQAKWIPVTTVGRVICKTAQVWKLTPVNVLRPAILSPVRVVAASAATVSITGAANIIAVFPPVSSTGNQTTTTAATVAFPPRVSNLTIASPAITYTTTSATDAVSYTTAATSEHVETANLFTPVRLQSADGARLYFASSCVNKRT